MINRETVGLQVIEIVLCFLHGLEVDLVECFSSSQQVESVAELSLEVLFSELLLLHDAFPEFILVEFFVLPEDEEVGGLGDQEVDFALETDDLSVFVLRLRPHVMDEYVSGDVHQGNAVVNEVRLEFVDEGGSFVLADYFLLLQVVDVESVVDGRADQFVVVETDVQNGLFVGLDEGLQGMSFEVEDGDEVVLRDTKQPLRVLLQYLHRRGIPEFEEIYFLGRDVCHDDLSFAREAIDFLPKGFDIKDRGNGGFDGLLEAEEKTLVFELVCTEVLHRAIPQVGELLIGVVDGLSDVDCTRLNQVDFAREILMKIKLVSGLQELLHRASGFPFEFRDLFVLILGLAVEEVVVGEVDLGGVEDGLLRVLGLVDEFVGSV